MWRNPKFAEQGTQTTEAPAERGRRLATFDRSTPKAEEEFRVSLDEYDGHPYVSLRVWSLMDGQWWPVKGRGCSVRIAECADLAAALKRAEQLAHEAEETPRYVNRGRERRQPIDPGTLPKPGGHNSDFDETEG
jgi:hypothetical protein